MKTIRYGGSVRTRTVPRGNPIGYPSTSAPLDGKRYSFNGTNMYATIPVWQPTTLDYVVEASAILDVLINGTTGQYILGGTGFQIGLTSLNNGFWAGKLMEAPATARTYTTSSSTEVGVATTMTMTVSPTTVQITVNDNVGSAATSATENTIPWSRIGGFNANSYLDGLAGEIHLIDTADPTNSRYYPINEGTGATILCYEGDLTTPDPTNNGTIVNFNEANWVTVQGGKVQ